MDCYVYYKAKEEDEQRVIDSFHHLRLLLTNHGLTPILQRRPKSKDQVHTWMEVYRGISSNFETVLEGAIRQSELTEFIIGSRHAEYFITV